MKKKLSVFFGCLYLSLLFMGCVHVRPSVYNLAQPPQGADALLASTEDSGLDAPTRLGWYHLLYTGDVGRARERLEQAVAVRPPSPDALFGLAIVRHMHGRSREGIELGLEMLSRYPQHAYSEVFAESLRREIGNLSQPFRLEIAARLFVLVADPRLNHHARSSLRRALLRIYDGAGQWRKHREQVIASGLVEKFLLVGPFGEYPYLELDRPFPPERGAIAAHYETALGEVKTHEEDRWSHPIQINEIAERDGLFYAVSYGTLRETTDVLLEIYADRPLRLLVDGEVAYKHDPHLAHSPRRAIVPLRLSQGAHRFVVKIVTSGQLAFFHLRALDRSGFAAPIEWSAGLEDQPEVGRRSLRVLDPPQTARESMSARLEASEKDAVAWTVLGFLESRAGDAHHARVRFDRAVGAAARFWFARYLRGLALEADPSLPTEITRNARDDFQAVLKGDPDNLPAALKLAALDLQEERKQEGLARLTRLMRLAPDHPTAYRALFAFYRDHEWRAEAVALLGSMLEKFPDHIKVLQLAAGYWESLQRFHDEERVWAKIGELNPYHRGWFRYLEKTGREERLLARVRELRLLKPGDRAAMNREMKLLRRLGRHEESLEVVRALRALPGGEDTRVLDTYNLEALAQDPQQAWQRLLDFAEEHPEEFKIRRPLKLLSGERELSEFEADGLALVREFESLEHKPRAGSVAVLDGFSLRLLADGSRISRVHLIDHIQNQEAKDRLGQLRLPSGVTLYQLRGIKPDGTILEPEHVGGSTGLTLPGLSIGDYVERDYVEYDPVRDGSSRKFTETAFVFRSDTAPTWRSRLVALHPETVDLRYQTFNMRLAPEESTSDGVRVWRWEAGDLPRFIPENQMPSRDEVKPVVYFYEPSEWSELRKLLADGLRYRFRATAELAAFAKAHIEEKAGAPANAESLFDAVRAQVRGFQPSSFNGMASRVLASREGSRLVLLKALYDIVGIDSRFVMYMPIDRRDPGYRSARLGLYSQTLLEVRAGEERIYLDGNFEHGVFGQRNPDGSGARAMVIDGGDEDFITLPEIALDPKERSTEMNIRLNAKAEAAGAVRESVEGYYAAPFRRQLIFAKPEEIKQYYEGFLSRTFRSCSVARVTLERLEEPGEPLTVAYDFLSQGYAQKLVGERMMVAKPTIPFLVGRMYVRKVDRAHPLVIDRPRALHERYAISPPEGYRPETIPESARIEAQFGAFTIDYHWEAGTLTIEKTLVVPIQRVAPGEEYGRFLRFVTGIDRLDARPLHFVK